MKTEARRCSVKPCLGRRCSDEAPAPGSDAAPSLCLQGSGSGSGWVLGPPGEPLQSVEPWSLWAHSTSVRSKYPPNVGQRTETNEIFMLLYFPFICQWEKT